MCKKKWLLDEQPTRTRRRVLHETPRWKRIDARGPATLNATWERHGEGIYERRERKPSEPCSDSGTPIEKDKTRFQQEHTWWKSTFRHTLNPSRNRPPPTKNLAKKSLTLKGPSIKSSKMTNRQGRLRPGGLRAGIGQGNRRPAQAPRIIANMLNTPG